MVSGTYVEGKACHAGGSQADQCDHRAGGRRVPLSSKNPDIDPMANGKSRIILLNKCDLADAAVTAQWKKYYEKKGFFVALVNSKQGKGVKQVNEVIQSACKEKIERDRRRGILNRPIRAMIVGIPNVGKSTFINSFAGKACTKTGNKPGVTKGKQWIRLNKNVELLDTRVFYGRSLRIRRWDFD